MTTKIKLIPYGTLFATALFFVCDLILIFTDQDLKSSIFVSILFILLLCSLYVNWATLVINGDVFEYRKKWGDLKIQLPVSAIKYIKIERSLWYKSKGSIQRVLLIIEEGNKRYNIPVSSPFFVGGPSLKRAQRLRDLLGVPIRDPQIEKIQLKKFLFYKWNIAGQEWKTLVLILGLGALLAVVLSRLK